MAERDLDIRLKLDRTQADQSARQFHQGERQRTGETTAAWQRIGASIASWQKMARDASGQSVAMGQQGKAAFEGLGKAGKDNFDAIGFAMARAQVGFNLMINLAGRFGQEMSAASERSRDLTKQFIEQRDSLGELATLMGRPMDNKFALEISRFNAAVGFKPEEGRQFLTELYNAGAQYKGTRISDEEFEQYTKQAGRLGMARRIEPNIMGDLAGSVLGFKDYRQFGEQASEQALGTINQALAVLGAGKGANASLARQFTMLASASLNEEEMMGVFQDPAELAAVVSIAAEQNPEEAAQTVRATMRGLRGFDKKRTAGLLQRAGITPQTGYIEAIRQLAPVVTEEAETTGMKTEDVLSKYFEDQLTRTGIATMINRGVVGGGFEQRLAFGARVQGPGPALAMTREYAESERGRNRMMQAEVEQAREERASETTKLDLVRLEALRNLERRREIDSADTAVMAALRGAMPVSLVGEEKLLRIDEEAQRLIQERMPAGAPAGRWSDLLNVTPLAREREMIRRIEEGEAAGGEMLPTPAGLEEERGGPTAGAEKMESAAGKHEEAAGMLMQAAQMLMSIFGGDQTPPKLGAGGPNKASSRTGMVPPIDFSGGFGSY